ncbi:hypothetical protein BVRB_7g168610 [Beta vulgaris subsp. vulgaris]|nr:hypothetical protein BVRB_7g168610 [Beta vulgaris subsp. vulgaris]
MRSLSLLKPKLLSTPRTLLKPELPPFSHSTQIFTHLSLSRRANKNIENEVPKLQYRKKNSEDEV